MTNGGDQKIWSTAVDSYRDAQILASLWMDRAEKGYCVRCSREVSVSCHGAHLDVPFSLVANRVDADYQPENFTSERSSYRVVIA